MQLVIVIFLFDMLSAFSVEVQNEEYFLPIIVNRFQTNCLVEEKWQPKTTPIDVINRYHGWVKARSGTILVETFENLISETEFQYMKTEYSNVQWKAGTWNGNNGLYLVTDVSECQSKSVIHVSEPISNEDKSKLLVYIEIETEFTTSFTILSLTKVEDNWIIMGRVPMAIGHKK